MRRIEGHRLWIGNAGDLRDPRAVLSAGVEAVVELADGEAYTPLPRDLIRCRFPLSDGGENPTWLLRLAIDSVSALISAKVPVLVCCSAGMSRSVCIAAAGLAQAESRPFLELLRQVSAQGPVDVSPGLMHQVQQAVAPGRKG